MNRYRIKRIALCAIAGIVLLSVFFALLFVGEQKRTRLETGAVLSAVISEEVLRDIDKWRAGRTVEIVIQRNPDCHICPIVVTSSWFGMSLKSRWDELSDAWFAQSSRMTRTSFFVNSLFSTDISTDLKLPIGAHAFFVNANELGRTQGDFEAKYPNNLGYFVVSHIGLNLKRTEALLYVDHFCPGLCGGGAYILVRKADGVWRVVDERGLWVS